MPKALTIEHVEGGKPGQVYYPLKLSEVPKPKPGPGQLLVRISAAALNHRDLFIRQNLYPGISFEHPLFSDGYGVVVEGGDAPGGGNDVHQFIDKPVVLVPFALSPSDQTSSPDGSFSVPIGGSALSELGAGQEFACVNLHDVELAPPHLTPAEGAALPLVGLTAWRALVSKAGAQRGHNILITGIGGGVALAALQFAVALGANVWVTSGDDSSKIERAVRELGAKGGVSYKAADWDRQLAGMLPADRPYLDSVIDGAGGDVIKRTVRMLKHGGVIACYGMTVGPKMDWLMQAVLKNVELKGSTMGDREEFKAMLAFVAEHKIRPVVSRVVQGLDNLEEIEGLYEDMKAGRQFGKLVIDVGGRPSTRL